MYIISGCDSRVGDNVSTNSHLPFCHSEVAAYIKFTSELVEDRELGLVTKADMGALWGLYTGNNPPSGKFL